MLMNREKSSAQSKGGGVYLVAMGDVSVLINYALSDWLRVSVRDSFIEILCCHIQIKILKCRLSVDN